MIHHATIKRAASLGIILTDKGGTAEAFHAERNRRVENEDPKVAVFLCQIAAALAVEYPKIEIRGEGDAVVEGDGFWHIDDLADEEGNPIDDYTKPEALENATAMIIDAYAELGVEEGEDEEEPTGVVVVAERYKQEYRARGDATGCGDWLHQTLKRYTSDITVEGKSVKAFDHIGFTQMLVANGVTIKGKFAAMPESGSKGWEGRYRMNGRQMLEAPLLRAKGVLALENGQSIVMPDEDYDALLNLPRHKALKEELETVEAEAEDAAEQQ